VLSLSLISLENWADYRNLFGDEEVLLQCLRSDIELPLALLLEFLVETRISRKVGILMIELVLQVCQVSFGVFLVLFLVC
jgi:hypothetical protein